MPIYNVRASFEVTMVVVADDEDDAYRVAREEAREAIDDERPEPQIDLRGEVTGEQHLRDGWCADCVPYGGDGNTRLRDLLPPNCEAKPTGAVGDRSA